MLSYEQLAKKKVPAIFLKYHKRGLTEVIKILRSASIGDGYGNESLGTPVESAEIIVVRFPDKQGSLRNLNGGEYGTDKFYVPTFWDGAEIDIRQTDKLQRLHGGIAAELETFTVTEIFNYRAYYEVITTIDRNEN